MLYRLILTYQERSNKKSIYLHKFGFTRKEKTKTRKKNKINVKEKKNRMSLHFHKDEL